MGQTQPLYCVQERPHMGILFDLEYAILWQTPRCRLEDAKQEIVWNHVIKLMIKEIEEDVAFMREYRFHKIPERFLYKILFLQHQLKRVRNKC